MIYRDWLAEWLKCYVKPAVKERTYIKYVSQINRHINASLGGYGLIDLTPGVLQKFTAQLTERYAANTVYGIVSIVKNSLKRAVKLGIAEKEFTECIVMPKAREKRIECFTMEEQRKIEEYILRTEKAKSFGVVFCLYTGIRIGELLALKWEDLNLKNGTVYISRTCRDSWRNGKYVKVSETAKTASSQRFIPIPRQLMPKIRELSRKSKCAYFVDGRGEYGSQVRSYQKTFERMLKKLKLRHKGFHSLRHTFATRALECGMDIKTLSELLGHKNAAVTLNRYAHSLMSHKTEMMNRLGKICHK